MPLPDLIQKHFTPEERAAVNDYLKGIRTIVNAKSQNLTEEERIKYGSLGNHYKGFINKSADYHGNQPQLDSPDVDWVEFEADHVDHVFLDNLELALLELQATTKDTRITHAYDLWKAALTDKDYTDYKNKTGATGYEVKAREYKEFFQGGGVSTGEAETGGQ